MKEYTVPEMETEMFDAADVICTSDGRLPDGSLGPCPGDNELPIF